MTARVHVETPRLLLRDWTDADALPFAELNADPRVMEFFPALLDRAASDALMVKIRSKMDLDGYGLYAVETKASGAFIGIVGLADPEFEAPFMPATEVSWRLARRAWGQGLATEAAAAVRDHAFTALGREALVAFTAQWNGPSRRVMEKIGMTHDPGGDFIHPKLSVHHKLAPHLLYRIKRSEWLALTRD